VEGWNAACQKYGIKVLGYDYIARTVTDYYPILAKILPNNPGILGTHGGDNGALIIKQAREKGYKGQFLIPGAASASFIKTGGAENVEGTLHVGIDPTSELTPKGIKEFHQMYIQKYHEDPGAWSAWQTTPPYVLTQAMSKAGTVDDVEKIKAVLEKEWFDTPWGRVKFGGEKKYGLPHQMFHPIFMSTVKNGKIVVIDRVDAEEIEKILNE
jgi:ABC-type branched-subunit amino acid transport system substrate-binding protein